MASQWWRPTLGGEGHGLAWRVANVALFLLVVVAALVVIVGVMYLMLWLFFSAFRG